MEEVIATSSVKEIATKGHIDGRNLKNTSDRSDVEPKDLSYETGSVIIIELPGSVYSVDPLNKRINHYVEISGEPFILEFDDQGQVVLSHEIWSLVGIGENLTKAEINLHNEARELSKEFLEIPVSDMNSDAKKLRDFLFRVI